MTPNPRAKAARAVRSLRRDYGFHRLAPILVRVPPSHAQALKELSERTGRCVSDLLRQAVETLLAHHDALPPRTLALALDAPRKEPAQSRVEVEEAQDAPAAEALFGEGFAPEPGPLAASPKEEV